MTLGEAIATSKSSQPSVIFWISASVPASIAPAFLAASTS